MPKEQTEVVMLSDGRHRALLYSDRYVIERKVFREGREVGWEKVEEYQKTEVIDFCDRITFLESFKAVGT